MFKIREMLAPATTSLVAGILLSQNVPPEITTAVANVAGGTIKAIDFKQHKSEPQRLTIVLQNAIENELNSSEFEMPLEAKNALLNIFTFEKAIELLHISDKAKYLRSEMCDILIHFEGVDIDTLPIESIPENILSMVEKSIYEDHGLTGISTHVNTKEILRELAEIRNLLTSNKEERKVFLCANIPAVTPFFTGRKIELAEIEDRLNKYSWVDVVGIGGIGKTELVRRFAQVAHNAGRFHTVYFAKYDHDFEALLTKLEFINDERPKDNIAEHNYRLLQGSQEKILLIIDNFNRDITFRGTDTAEECSQKEAEQSWRDRLKGLPKTKVIFTTRNSIDGTRENPNDNQIFLSELENDDSLTLFYRHCSSASPYKKETSLLLAQIHRHTLVTILAARFLANKEYLSEKEILDLARQMAVTPAEIGFDEKYDSEIELHKDDRTWELQSIMHIERLFNISNLNTEEKYILVNMSLAPMSGISTARISKWTGITTINMRRIQKSGWLMSENGIAYLHPIVSNVVARNLKPTYEKCEKLLNGICLELKKCGIDGEPIQWRFHVPVDEIESILWLCDLIKSSVSKLLEHDPDSAVNQLDFFGGGIFLLSVCGQLHDFLPVMAKYSELVSSIGGSNTFDDAFSRLMSKVSSYGKKTVSDFTDDETEKIMKDLHGQIETISNIERKNLDYPQQTLLLEETGVCYGTMATLERDGDKAVKKFKMAIKYTREALSVLNRKQQTEADSFQIAVLHGRIGNLYIHLLSKDESNRNYMHNAKHYLDFVCRLFDEKQIAFMAEFKFMQIVLYDNVTEFRKSPEDTMNELLAFVKTLERIKYKDVYLGMSYNLLSNAYKKTGDIELSKLYAKKQEDFEYSYKNM